MAFRGRGRGRGRGGGYERPPNFTPYENFPDMERLPNLVDIIHSSHSQETKMNAQMNALRKSQLEEFWRGSCYYLQEDASRTKKELGTRRILGKKPKTQERREALGNYLKLNPSNFPVELIQGSRRVQQISKKLKWDRHADQLAFDSFEKLEEKHKDKDEKVEKKQDEDEDEEPQEDADEESSDDDYNQNIDFDDDEDDMNMEEDAEEDVYD
ncbi:uncharacterized protein LOC144551074 [Carex rostrata]